MDRVIIIKDYTPTPHDCGTTVPEGTRCDVCFGELPPDNPVALKITIYPEVELTEERRKDMVVWLRSLAMLLGDSPTIMKNEYTFHKGISQ